METFISQNSPLLAQLGFAVIFFLIYWYERKENKELTKDLRDKYSENTKAFEGLKSTIESIKDSQKNALDNNTRAVDNLVNKVDLIFRTNGKDDK